jgi:DNA-binding SARP family transcriptional activator
VPRGGVLDYFLAQFFSRFSKQLQQYLLTLSLLDTTPIGLAEELTARPDARELLAELSRQNLFVRPLDATRTEYVFHHLFLNSLRSLARQRLSPGEIVAAHRLAARWYRQQDRPVEALGHLFAAEDFAAAEQLLREVGSELLANNLTITLHQALRRIPEEVIRGYGWLSYFAGVSMMEIDPPAALSHLENAHCLFLTGGEELGELLTLVRLISFHVLVDGRHHLGATHLDRAAVLFEKKVEELTPTHRAHASNVLLMGFITIRNDTSRADTYYNLGLKIAREHRLPNLEAEARLWRCYRHIFAGCYPECFAEIEEAAPLLHSPLVNSINKAALYLAFVNALAQTGDHASYHYHRSRVQTMKGGDLVDRSVIGAFMMLWNIDLAFALGNFAQAREILMRALTADFAGASPHLRSMYLQYYALLLARDGKREAAVTAADESRLLRAEIGCPFFVAYNCLLVGAANARLGNAEEAFHLFREGLETVSAIGDWFIRGGLHAQRAQLYLDLGQTENAQNDIREVLENLHRQDYVHFRSWTPELMERILAEAVRGKIRHDFARELAGQRLGLGILPDGTTIPLLQIRTLGSLELRIRQRIVLRGGEMTPAQRQLLAILLTSPGLQRGQEEVTALLWPESPVGKARKNFDALLIRLRKTVQEASGGEIDSRFYIPLRKGVLSLEHCRVDALDFRARGIKGLRHLRKGENWQADNVLRSALGLWQGEFLAGMTLPDPAEISRQDLAALFLECSCRWSGLLSSDGRYEEARQVADAALRHDPIHDDLVRILYEIHTAQSKPVKARKVLDDYAAALRVEQLSEDEVEQILESFWTRPA